MHVKGKGNFFFFLLTGTVNSNLLVILFKSCEILASLGKFSFLHTLADVPMNECTLRVQEIEFMIETRPRIGDGGCAMNALVSGRQVLAPWKLTWKACKDCERPLQDHHREPMPEVRCKHRARRDVRIPAIRKSEDTLTLNPVGHQSTN